MIGLELLRTMPALPSGARLYAWVISGFGLFLLFSGFATWESRDPIKFLCYFLITLLGSGLRVSLPSAAGSLPVNLLFVLIGVIDLSVSETLALAVFSTLVQVVAHHSLLWQCVFQIAVTAIGVTACQMAYQSEVLVHNAGGLPVRLLLTGAALFAANTLPVATVIALAEAKHFRRVWREGFLWTFTYYFAGAAAAGLYVYASRLLSWQLAMLIIPVFYLIYRSYGLYMARIDAERKHAEEMSALHLRTIEALALAIEAKDNTTHDHLQRVQIYALEVGRELELSDLELEALRTASLLHDIGKLAVPEHIISKPGRLTPEEFEKMKIHPVVGAEILERVAFPYPVVPIVRSHHEKWDGSGYPHGLRGEEIPIGARILAAVDCLDALASDRQYRKALPLDEAMGVVRRDAGKAFDPRVVEVLERRYRDLEAQAQEKSAALMKVSTDVKFERGLAPAAGFAGTSAPTSTTNRADFLASIAAARQEVQGLFEITQDLGSSLSLDETLSLLAVRLKRMVPYDSLAVYIRRPDDPDLLVPEYVTGENFRLFSTLRIPLGQGLSGWVAENRKPIVNGNPSVEPGYLNDSSRFSTLRSALGIHLEGPDGVMGVLALYHADKDIYNNDHLRILMAISSKVGLAIDNALKFEQVASSATTDYLTGLPNARSLFLHLDGEIARARRTNGQIAVLVCDLDGFKQVNDRYGHLEGNKVLKLVARGFRECCREYDYVARMGGDEFVLVLPGMAAKELDTKVKRLMHIASEAGRDGVGDDILSASVGTAHFPEDGSDAETLLAEADKRMYRVKQSHRLGGKKTERSFDWRKAATFP